jgi:hypothetical protein
MHRSGLFCIEVPAVARNYHGAAETQNVRQHMNQESRINGNNLPIMVA